MCFGEDFCSAAAAVLAAACFEAPVSSGVRSSGELREGQSGSQVGLSLFCAFCKLKSHHGARQGDFQPLSVGLKAGSLRLGVAADGHGKEVISWESFQDTSSKGFGVFDRPVWF